MISYRVAVKPFLNLNAYNAMKCPSNGQIVGILVILLITTSFIFAAIYGAVTGDRRTDHSAAVSVPTVQLRSS